MRIIIAALVLVFVVSTTHAQMTKVLDPASDFEISWNGGGTWTPYTITTYSFTTGSPGQHKPFAVFGLNKLEADITGVIVGDPDTLAKWEVTITDPGVAPQSIWLIGWVRWRIRVQIGSEQDTSLWSDTQVISIKRPKPAPTPRLVK